MKHFAYLVGGALLALPAASAELTDPTRPADAKSATVVPATTDASKPTRLEAILHGQDWAMAIINGKLLHVGDWVGDARIVAIDADSVRFTRAGHSLTLRLARQAMQVRRTAGTEDPQ